MRSYLMKKIAVVDIEATGPNFEKGDRMIQIAAVIYQDGKILGQHNMYINPEMAIPQHIQQLTGITQDVVEKAPTFKQVAPLWYERLKDCLIVAHNLAFDLVMLQESFLWANEVNFNPSAIDTVKLAKILVPWADGFNLTQLANYYELPYKDAHDAASDAYITMQILSKLGDEVLNLDNELFNRLYPYIVHLPHDEKEFFDQPQMFLIQTQYDSIVFNDNQTIEHEQNYSLMSQLIVEKISHHPRLIFEKMNPAIKNSELVDVIKQLAFTKPMVIGFESLNRLNWFVEQLDELMDKGSVVVLKKDNHYLHLPAFEELIATKEIHLLNQQEIISIAATIRWLSTTQTGDYAEIRDELVVQPLLEKYCRSTLANKVNPFYSSLIKAAKKADLILMEAQKISTANLQTESYLFNRRILILNYEDWVEKQRLNQQSRLPVSFIFTELQSVFDFFVYQATLKPNENELNIQLNRLMDIFYELNEVLKNYIDKSDEVKSTKHSYEYFLSDSLIFELNIGYFLNELKAIALSIDHLLKQARVVTDYRLQRLIQLILTFVYQDSDQYLIVKGQFSNHFVHNIELIARPLFIENPFNENPKQEVYLFSRRFYQYKQKSGSYQWIKNNHFQPLQLPNQIEQSIDIKLPVGYINTTDFTLDNNTEQDWLTDDTIAIKQQVDFLTDFSDQLENRIIILAANQKAKELTYEMIKKSKILTELYGVLCPGINGSLNRVLRRQEEMEKSILILTFSNCYSFQMNDTKTKRTILIQRLPFANPNIPILNALAKYNRWDIHLEFDQLHLPLMQSRLNDLVLQLAVNPTVDQLYLFDDRVFTKYYSYELRNNLNPWINFFIYDD